MGPNTLLGHFRKCGRLVSFLLSLVSVMHSFFFVEAASVVGCYAYFVVGLP